MTRGKARAVAAIIAVFGALVPTLVALSMMAENNNNSELYDTVTGQWDIGYALALSGAFYIPSFLLIFALAYGLTRPSSGEADDY